MAVVETTLHKPPKLAPGEGVSAALRRSPVWVKAAQLVASDFVGDSVKELFQVEEGSMIVDFVLLITQAFNNAGTIAIGDGSDTDRFMAADQYPAGSYSMKQGGQPGSGGGYVYSALDTIDLVSAGGTPTAGTIDAWVAVIFDADELGGL